MVRICLTFCWVSVLISQLWIRTICDDVRKIVQLGLDVEGKGRNILTPLLVAANEGKVEIFHYFLSIGCNVNAVAKSGYNLLHLASLHGHNDIIAHFMKLNTRSPGLEDIDDDDYTPLLIAVFRDQVNTVKYFVQLGSNVSARTDDDRTVLHYAAARASLDMVKYLISLKAVKPEWKDKHGRTPLMFAKHLKDSYR